ncbi:hypothetical protein AgCh_024048 [Apium graveolens]
MTEFWSGEELTRWNKCHHNLVYRKLDRVLVNDFWLDYFPESYCDFLRRGLSNHNPVITKTGLRLLLKKRPFQYFSYLEDLNYFQALVTEAWHEHIVVNPWDIHVDLLQNHIYNTQASHLVRPFHSSKVLDTLKIMAKNKNPGPNGFPVEFFMDTWSITGNDVTNAILCRDSKGNRGPPKCAIKLDLHKVFDGVNWKFIFQGNLGLRQGDPLPPYLYVIVMEVFSSIISSKSQSPRFSYQDGR